MELQRTGMTYWVHLILGIGMPNDGGQLQETTLTFIAFK